MQKITLKNHTGVEKSLAKRKSETLSSSVVIQRRHNHEKDVARDICQYLEHDKAKHVQNYTYRIKVQILVCP